MILYESEIGASTSPQRHSIRLKGYDYSQAGWYYITICTYDREHLFGEIFNGEMVINDLGRIAHDQWLQIPARFDQVELGAFVVMPNHIHGIIIIDDMGTVGAGFTHAPDENTTIKRVGAGFTHAPCEGATINRVGASPTPTPTPGDDMGNRHTGRPDTGQPRGVPLRGSGRPEGVTRRETLGDIVGAYKSLTANEWLKIIKSRNEIMGKIWQRNYYEHIIRNEESYLKITQYIRDNPAQWEVDSLNPGNMP